MPKYAEIPVVEASFHLVLRPGPTVTAVPLEGVARGKHIDGGMMCDGWPAGPAFQIL